MVKQLLAMLAVFAIVGLAGCAVPLNALLNRTPLPAPKPAVEVEQKVEAVVEKAEDKAKSAIDKLEDEAKRIIKKIEED